MLKFRWLTLVLLICFAVTAVALADEGRLAWDGDRSALQSIDVVDRWLSPTVDVAKLIREDEANADRKDIPHRIGYPMQVDLSPANSGTWEELPDGDLLWRLRVESAGAKWTVLGFDAFRLQKGAALSVYDAQGKTVMGPYTVMHRRNHGQLWFPPIVR